MKSPFGFGVEIIAVGLFVYWQAGPILDELSLPIIVGYIVVRLFPRGLLGRYLSAPLPRCYPDHKMDAP